MIINIGDALDGLDEAGWNKYILSVQHLIQAHMHGWHILVPSRRAFEVIRSHPLLPPRYQEAFSVLIGERLSTLSGYANAVCRKIVCLPDSQSEFDDGAIVGVNLRHFEDLENCFKSKLIVENVESDGKFYSLISKELSSEGSLSVPLALEIVGGGGNTTVWRVSESVERARPSITIVDGDKTHPGDQEGETAQAVRSAFAARRHSTHRLFVTTVRSLENFIPLEICPHFLASKIEPLKSAGLLAEWQKRETDSRQPADECLTGYLSFKKGMKVSSYRKSSQAFKQNIASLANYMGISIDFPANDFTGKDSEILFSGICKSFAADFILYIEESGLEGLKGSFSEYPFKEEIRHIVEAVVAYGASLRKAPYKLAA